MDMGDYWQGLLAFEQSGETGSFTQAGKSLGLSPSAVGRAVTRLEKRLGVSLFKRSTRTLVLTTEGRDFQEQIAPALATIREAERTVRQEQAATGTVRISASIDLGRTLIASWAAELAKDHPGLKLELDVTDRLVDLRREGIDIAVRVGSLPPPGLVGERLANLGYATVASPDYIEAHGTPTNGAELVKHNCLQYLTNDGAPLRWTLDGDHIVTEGNFATGDAGALLAAALSGAGIAYMLRFAVETALSDGRLKELMVDIPKTELPVSFSHAFGERPPARVRVVLEFLRKRLAR